MLTYPVYDNLLLSHEIDWNNEHVDCRRTTNGAWFAPSGDSTSLSTHQSTGYAAFTWLASSSAAGIGIVPRMYSGKYSPNDRSSSEVALEPMDTCPPELTLLAILSGSYCGLWPIKCRRGYKKNKSNCRF